MWHTKHFHRPCILSLSLSLPLVLAVSQMPPFVQLKLNEYGWETEYCQFPDLQVAELDLQPDRRVKKSLGLEPIVKN